PLPLDFTPRNFTHRSTGFPPLRRSLTNQKTGAIRLPAKLGCFFSSRRNAACAQTRQRSWRGNSREEVGNTRSKESLLGIPLKWVSTWPGFELIPLISSLGWIWTVRLTSIKE